MKSIPSDEDVVKIIERETDFANEWDAKIKRPEPKVSHRNPWNYLTKGTAQEASFQT